MDVDVSLYFHGNFGNIDFRLDSSPKFNSTDPDAAQKILLSYIMFGQDMTGLSTGSPTNYTQEQLQAIYRQKVGPALEQAGDDLINRYFSNLATTTMRPIVSNFLGANTEIDIKSKIPIVGPSTAATPGTLANVENPGNTLTSTTSEVFAVQLKRYLDNKFSLTGELGVNNNQTTGQAGVQGRFGVGLDLQNGLNLDLSAGQNENDQTDARAFLSFSRPLPNIANPEVVGKEKPHISKFEIVNLIPGKVELDWETDKRTRSEVDIYDSDNHLVKTKKDDIVYKHAVVIEGLNPSANYKIHIVASDDNQNQQTLDKPLPATSEQ